MKAIIKAYSAFLLLAFLAKHAGAVVPSNLRCDGRGVIFQELRIEACVDQPCNITKGVNLTYEIDFNLAGPNDTADVVRSAAFIDYYSVPPPQFGSYLSDASCEDGNFGFDCPIAANVTHTIETDLFIHPEAVCHFGCENMGENGTGLSDTQWYFGTDDSVCTFQVTLNINE